MTSVLNAVTDNNNRILKLLVAVPGCVPQRELQGALFLAAKKGYAECLECLLHAGIQPDLHDTNGSTPLKVAAEEGHRKAVRVLIKNGADINNTNHYAGTPLHYASKHGQDHCVDELLCAGADLNTQDSGGNTPLIHAAKNCHQTWKVIKRLIDHKCNLDLQDSSGRTALHYICHKGLGSVLLLAAGANPDIQDNEGNTPVLLAAIEGFDPVIESLAQYKCNPNIKNNYFKSAIHFLAMKNHWQGIDALADVGGDMNIVDDQRKTPLWYAVNHNRPEAVKALLRANCHPDPLFYNEQPRFIPLQTALEKKLYGIAKLLILAGCDLAPLYDWIALMEQNRLEEERRRNDFRFYFAENQPEVEEDLDGKEALAWFEDWLHTPHSLRQVCRIFIRRHIGGGIVMKVENLPLPPVIVDYITLKEVDDHHVEGYLI